MSKETVILEQGQGPKPEAETAHAEAMEFFNRNRDFFQHYARGEITVKPAPPNLNTFAFNLENNEIYLNSRFYKERGFPDEKTSFATLHEIEHMLEKKKLLAEPNGARIFERYLGQIEADKAYSLMDNCVADIRENRAVVSRTSSEFQETESRMYRENLFPDADFTSRPRHIQFVEALLNESRLPDRKLQIDSEVRAKLDELKSIKNKKGIGLIEAMTHPDLSMADRLRLQNHFIWPIVEELRKKDVEDRKDRPKNGNQGGGPEGEPKEGGTSDPNEIFSDDYAEANKRTPNATPVEEIDKAFKKWKEARGEDPLDRADRDYAGKIGVKPEDLNRYRGIVKSLEMTIDPETNESVIEELRNLFARIISRRSKPVLGPRYPVSEGEDLVDPSGLVSGVKGGDLEPKVWETTEIIQRPGKMFGEVEITLVCDRSESMAQEGKLPEQRKAAVLIMEALKEFNDLLDGEKPNLIRPLEVRSEIYSFQATDQDSRPLKPMSKELTEKDRIYIAGILSSAPGLQKTTDFVSLEAIDAAIGDEMSRKIKEGELKKIVIVLTDGISSDADRVKTVVGKMRKGGIVVVGVGVTEAGKPAIETYAPDARLVEKAENLAKVLKDLLKEHLADV